MSEFRLYTPADWSGLLEMYRTFEPKGAFQGLPPIKEATRRSWLEDLVENQKNTNFMVRLDDGIIAHAALVDYPAAPLEQEIVIFVHQRHQGEGWGRRLFLAAMHWACLHRELKRVWLTVEWYNVKARSLYQSLGFVPVPGSEWEGEDMEVDMQLLLPCAHCGKIECPVHSVSLDICSHDATSNDHP